jgi:hypothetical protein
MYHHKLSILVLFRRGLHHHQLDVRGSQQHVLTA